MLVQFIVIAIVSARAIAIAIVIVIDIATFFSLPLAEGHKAHSRAVVLISL